MDINIKTPYVTEVVEKQDKEKQKYLNQLKKLGIYSEDDLLLHLPFRYEDETILYNVKDAFKCGKAVSINLEVQQTFKQKSTAKTYFYVMAFDRDGIALRLKFMQYYSYLPKIFQQGVCIRIFGRVNISYDGSYEIIQPKYKILTHNQDAPITLTPIYSITVGLSQNVIISKIKQIIHKHLKNPDSYLLKESIPEDILKELKLPGFARSVLFLHAPFKDCNKELLYKGEHPAFMRIKFDEILAQQLSLKKAVVLRKAKIAPNFKIDGQNVLASKICENLPFELTGDQKQVLTEIYADLDNKYPMNRLVQGDVGAGKTIVAALVATKAIMAGWQTAIMAPTEVLAEQHFNKFKMWFEPLNIKVVGLFGKPKIKQKREYLKQIAIGSANIIVGTHALIQDAVQYYKLGLVIIDEQHRFGVEQRLNLLEYCQQKFNIVPHQLMMTATPIPRTLAMSYYADLAVSSIKTLPPGRTPIKTIKIPQTKRAEIVEKIKNIIQTTKQQVYWVCPLVNESETLDLQNAIETEKYLKQTLPNIEVALIHGKLKSDEKNLIMHKFINNEVQVLVATTVIEVGVDVPNATIIVIEHAERFGLSQLHQLRGRVGRGSQASKCILLYSWQLSDIAKQRLQVMINTTDGFEISQQDLLLRGFGDIIGTKQSGMTVFKYADIIKDEQLIQLASKTADIMLEKYPEYVNIHLNKWLNKKQDFLNS